MYKHNTVGSFSVNHPYTCLGLTTWGWRDSQNLSLEHMDSRSLLEVINC